MTTGAAGDNNTNPSVGVVVPLLNEAENLPDLIGALESVLEPYPDYQVLLVDDGSTDSSLKVIREAAGRNRRIRYLSLTRNFGQQLALKTGLSHCDADVVISMDADLQHPPAQIPTMIDAWRDGYKVVNMIRSGERTSILKRLTSKIFYRLINAISDFEISPGSSDFRLLDKQVVDLIRAMPERCVFLRGLIPWLGFEQIDVEFEVPERKHGERKYRLTRMLQLALTGITSSSIRPLRLAFIIGATTSSFAAFYAAYALSIKIFYDAVISGWTSLLIGLMLLGGIQLLMLGVIGEYVGRVFLEVKNRPDTIVADSNID